MIHSPQKKPCYVLFSIIISSLWHPPSTFHTDPFLSLTALPPGQVPSSSHTSLWLFPALLLHASANQLYPSDSISPSSVNCPHLFDSPWAAVSGAEGMCPVLRCRVTKPCGLPTCQRGFSSGVTAWVCWSSFLLDKQRCQPAVPFLLLL